MRMLVDTAEKVNKSGLLDNTDPVVVLQRLRQVNPVMINFTCPSYRGFDHLYLYLFTLYAAQSCHNRVTYAHTSQDTGQ